jgi:hypothetical protein
MLTLIRRSALFTRLLEVANCDKIYTLHLICAPCGQPCLFQQALRYSSIHLSKGGADESLLNRCRCSSHGYIQPSRPRSGYAKLDTIGSLHPRGSLVWKVILLGQA